MKKSIVIAGILVVVISLAAVQAYALSLPIPNQQATRMMSNYQTNGSCSMNNSGMMNGSMMGGGMMNGQSMNQQQCRQYMGQNHSMTNEQCQGMM